MTFAIFTLVQHKKHRNKYYGYAPYVREMDIWNSHFDHVIVVAPISSSNRIDSIDIAYKNQNITFFEVPVLNVKSLSGILKVLVKIPSILFRMFNVMRKADHLHFRCPSNIAAMASLVQLFFPKKKKTMRYAGNWDPKSVQPFGYRFQKFIFSNTLLTRNITTLVYGDWPKPTKSMRTFFAATFHEQDKVDYKPKNYRDCLNFTFIGALVPGKQPLMAIKIMQLLNTKGVKCKLNIFGDGILKDELINYIRENEIEHMIKINGNVTKKELMTSLQSAHFNILPSKSEGWPKAIAEGMFFGVIPISTNVSCVEWMLDYGKRGIIIENNVKLAVEDIREVISSRDLNVMAKEAQDWSQKYTIEKQSEEINDILST
ncbi:glycosyltransferase [Winogradskyella alexanderae]|uniref:Glycosyltransferase n=1 Tax=Winogradskyella alexanderae TaxID=2877123 RepID=A0ABS7XPM7_9FLAO|nr:glycosyltransferase [Winogradskyella alexanderae]MCA0131967.1 glycosyltransferase [Winogradskyella alexanderae]